VEGLIEACEPRVQPGNFHRGLIANVLVVALGDFEPVLLAPAGDERFGE
jgi:hypothetical protein